MFGDLEGVVRHESGEATILLRGAQGCGSIICNFENPSEAGNAFSKLKYPQRVSVKGRVPPGPLPLTNMHLGKCQLQEIKDKV